MPELPEVEIITRELRSSLIGEKIIAFEVEWYKTLQMDDTISLAGREIKNLDRKGKYIIFNLDKGFLVAHLRMTGKFLINKDNNYSTDHLRVVFHLASKRKLLFYDIRKFGRIFFTCNIDEVLKNVGIDFLSSEFTIERFSYYFKKGRKKLKSFLMDQKYFAGLGNIYTDESLFKARLHPESTMDTILSSDIVRLYNSIIETLVKSVQNMGTTISDYKTTRNMTGQNQDYLFVYDRENKPCFICGCLIKRIKVNNRSTYFCPCCQKR
jgi:formamidopyrimidine-DNA glycosylase